MGAWQRRPLLLSCPESLVCAMAPAAEQGAGAMEMALAMHPNICWVPGPALGALQMPTRLLHSVLSAGHSWNPHSTEGETEAQSGEATCPGSRSVAAFPGSVDSEAVCKEGRCERGSVGVCRRQAGSEPGMCSVPLGSSASSRPRGLTQVAQQPRPWLGFGSLAWPTPNPLLLPAVQRPVTGIAPKAPNPLP